MEKRFGIFWLSQQREIYGDDSYYVLGMLWKIVDTNEEAENEIVKINLRDQNLVTIIPVYSGISK